MFLAFSVLHAGLPNVAVIPVAGDEGLTAQQLSFITGQLSSELVKSQTFTVLDRGQMEYILKEQGFQQGGACNSSECQVQMGQLLGVEYIVAGTLVRFGRKYALRADYIEVGTGKVANSVDSDAEGDLEDVYKPLCQGVGQKLAKAVREKMKGVAGVEAPAQLEPVPEVPTPETLAQDLQPESATRVSAQLGAPPSKPLSGKRKVALALGGSSLLGAGAGWYFNGQGNAAVDDYDTAVLALSKSDAADAHEQIDAAENRRNVSYGVSVGALVLGAVLWFWPE